MKSTSSGPARLKKSESSVWMHFANFFAIMLWALALADWRAGNSLEGMLLAASIIYALALAVFCGEKEYERWHGYHRTEGSGESYVAVWTLIIAWLFFFGGKGYSIPPELVASYIIVVVFYGITDRSKELFELEH